MQITFRATIPAIQSALKIGGDGMRVQFDVPETDKLKALGLAALTSARLKITVEVDESE